MGFLAVLYAKAVDDKQDGIYFEDVYFGGLACDKDCASEIARECTNKVRGGTAIVKLMPVEAKNSLPDVFDEARIRFDKLEREMIETEDVLLANIDRAKNRRK